MTGRDGQVRGARLKVLLKTGKQSSAHRPVQRLILLEIQEKSTVNDENEENTEEDNLNEEEFHRKLRFRTLLAVQGLKERQQLKGRLCAEFANNIHSNYSKELFKLFKTLIFG